MTACRCGSNYDRYHYDLGHDRSQKSVHSCHSQVALAQLLVNHCALLIENHPWHDDSADVHGEKKAIAVLSRG
jgi:hypothetical protein